MYAHDVCVLLAFASAEANVFSVGREPNDWLSRIRNARLRPWRIYALGPFKDCSHKRNITGFEAQSLRMLPGTIPYHLGSSRKLGMTQAILFLGNASLDNLLRALYRGNVVFRIIRRFFLTQRYPRRRLCLFPGQGSRRTHEGGGVPKSYFMSVDARLITARHVSISQKYLSARPHTALVEEKHVNGNLLAAECYEQTSTKGSRWLIIALTAVVTTMTRSGDDFSRWSESAINTPV